MTISDKTTKIKVGGLLSMDPIIEDPDDKFVEKIHKSTDDLYAYIEKHVNTKLGRGYI